MRVALLHNRYRIRGGEEQTVDFQQQLLESAGHQVDRFELRNEDVFGRFGGGAVSSAPTTMSNGCR